MSPLWEDPRVAGGMQTQLARRQQRIDAGERPVGWKVGFGTPAAMGHLGIEAPLVGSLTSGGLIEPGGTASIAGAANPMLEPEIAVHMAADLEAGADRAAAQRAIAGIGPALELVDPDLSITDVEAIVAGNVFHRAVVLGPFDSSRAGGEAAGLRARVLRDGDELVATDAPTQAVGDLVDLTRHVADMLAAAGTRLRAGEAIITGTLVAPLPVAPGLLARYELDPVGTLELRIAG